MVAKITFPKSIEAALNYNEKKVQKENAVCLHAANYLNDAKDMNFYQKLHGFERLNSLNERATTKTLHVSLNFDPSEKLPDDKLVVIATEYMTKIGFGEQPFLVYRHEDAGHPHIHLVSTTIQDNGHRINTHNIGRNQSEKARKEIEQLYGLVKAERQEKLLSQKTKPIDINKALYGKQETKRSITNIVTAVYTQYKFASLPEFNAALKQFNVAADRGKEEGRIYKNRGLVYRVLDAAGNKVGVPIKASSIACKPILGNLEKRFVTNEGAKKSLQQRLKDAVDDCLKSSGSIQQFIFDLRQKEIYTLLRQNTAGRLYGITFVDNQNKCVFNGSDLGKDYSIAALQTRLSADLQNIIPPGPNKDAKTGAEISGIPPAERLAVKKEINDLKPASKNENLLELLLSNREQYDNVPSGLLKKKKRKKKRKDNNF